MIVNKDNNVSKQINVPSLGGSVNANELNKKDSTKKNLLNDESLEMNNSHEEEREKTKVLLDYIEIIERLEKINKDNDQAIKANNIFVEKNCSEKFYSIFNIGFTTKKISKSQEIISNQIEDKNKSILRKIIPQNLVIKIKGRRKIYKLINFIFNLPNLRLKVQFFNLNSK